MARGGGSIDPGGVYHLISRFVAKEWFIESDRERRTYLSLLGTALRATDWTCFSFAIMSSHIHLGVVTGTAPLAAWMRPMHTVFANWMNAQRERIGAVFVKGPNVLAVQPNACAKLINYIHYNPVRAGVVTAPSDSTWTSHRAYIGATRAPSWLSVEAGLALGGFTNTAEYAQWCATSQVDRESLAAVGALPRASRGRPRATERS